MVEPDPSTALAPIEQDVAQLEEHEGSILALGTLHEVDGTLRVTCLQAPGRDQLDSSFRAIDRYGGSKNKQVGLED